MRALCRVSFLGAALLTSGLEHAPLKRGLDRQATILAVRGPDGPALVLWGPGEAGAVPGATDQRVGRRGPLK